MFTLERPRIRDYWDPGGTIELDAANLRSSVAEEMDVRREVKMPVYACVLEKNMGDGVEVMVAGDDHKLDVWVRSRPFAETFVDPLLLVVDVSYAATAQRCDVTGKHHYVGTLGIEPLKVTVQV